MNRTFAQHVAWKTLDLLDERRARIREGKSFVVWAREDRLVVAFDTSTVDLGKLNADFAHRLSTRLQGRPVVRTNSRGLFLQVGYEIPPAEKELRTADLDLSKQPNPLDMPMGETTRGGLWVSLTEGDSFLVAGTRGFGKSRLLHGWIQALLHGGRALVYAYDGKQGVEFGRYIGRENFTYISNLGETLKALIAESLERRRTLLKSGCTSIADYNARFGGFDTPEDRAGLLNHQILPIALIVDEAALTTDAEREQLVRIVERERDTGFHPIYGTNRPEAAVLLVKSNLGTRVCFAVPSWNASQMALGMTGAENLPKMPGRGLIVFRARVREFQSYAVSVPEVGDDARLALESAVAVDDAAVVEPTFSEEARELGERIRGLWSPTMSNREVGRLTGIKYSGQAQVKRVNAVIEYLLATATKTAEMPVFEAVEA